jgi:hypothetical protein
MGRNQEQGKCGRGGEKERESEVRPFAAAAVLLCYPSNNGTRTRLKIKNTEDRFPRHESLSKPTCPLSSEQANNSD